MNTTSLWLDPSPQTRFPPPEADLTCEVLIVGGGIAGITAAYLLARAGKDVALLERHRLGQGDTGHTTAHVTQMVDPAMQELVDEFGDENAKLVWEAGREAIELIRENIESESIQCGWLEVPGYLVEDLLGEAEIDEDFYRQEYESILATTGEDADFFEATPLTGQVGVGVAHQAQFHPYQYLRGLAEAAVKAGARLFEETEAADYNQETHSLTANGHTVHCQRLILATHQPVPSLAGDASAMFLQTKLAAYTTYAVGARIPDSPSVTPALYSDRNDPYLYLRIDQREGEPYAIFGGEDHKTGQVQATEQAFRRLEKKLHQLFPHAAIDHRWSGQVLEPVDGLPYIGCLANGVFIATGFSGNGMTYGTIAALMARDWVLTGRSRWESTFSPQRKHLSDTVEYLRENKDYPFHMILDRLKTSGSLDLEKLKEGDGRVAHYDHHKVAACRLEGRAEPVLLSAICPHLGCVVAWNHAEQTWDCPCHGSRFAPTGEVLAGPAEEPLKPYSP